jgi:hypothetical protein
MGVVFKGSVLYPADAVEVGHLKRLTEINVEAVSGLLHHLSGDPDRHGLEANCKLIRVDVVIKTVHPLSLLTHLFEMRVLLNWVVFLTEPLVLFMLLQEFLAVVLVMGFPILFVVELKVRDVSGLHRCKLLIGD